MVTRPTFRNTSRGGGRGARGGESGATVWGSPFSQAQILHLMKAEFARSRRHGLALSVLVLQVDRLRALADLHGPELREAVRTALSKLLVENSRGSDLLGLLGDDRFVLLLGHTDEAAGEVAAERLRDRFAALDIQVRGQALALTLSVGLAGNADREVLFFDTVLSQAEMAVEWAMDDGGDRVVAFSRDRFAAEAPRPGARAADAEPGGETP